MQKAFATALYECIQKDPSVVLVLSDSGADYEAMIAREFPSQCINVGIAEQSQIGIAAGLAKCGKRPFVYTSGAFLAYRAYEFIRDDVCLPRLNVKIVGMGSGLSWSTMGPTHHATEDIACLRALPGLALLSPASPLETRAAVNAAYAHNGPVYVRIGMSDPDEIYTDTPELVFGECVQLCRGEDVAIFVTGSIAARALDVARILIQAGIRARVVNMPCLKPISEERISRAAQGVKLVCTLEEHSVVGGLGGIVAEALAGEGRGIPLLRIGLEDRFAVGYGTPDEVRAQNRFDAPDMAQRIRKKWDEL